MVLKSLFPCLQCFRNSDSGVPCICMCVLILPEFFRFLDCIGMCQNDMGHYFSNKFSTLT